MCPSCETNKLCVHAHSPLGVGAYIPCSLSQTGTPSLPQNYPRSSLLLMPPDPSLRSPRRPAPVLAVQACLEVRVFSLRADGGISWVTVHSQCHARSGLGSRVDAPDSPVTSGTLLPAGIMKPSATSKYVFSGLNTFTESANRSHCTSHAFVSTHQARYY